MQIAMLSVMLANGDAPIAERLPSTEGLHIVLVVTAPLT